MENLIVFLGLVSSMMVVVSGNAYVTVSKSMQVLPSSPTESVDVSLECTGSVPDLSFYIKNRVNWAYIGPDGTVYPLTQSFYQAPNSQRAEEGFKSNHYDFDYFSLENSVYLFKLDIKGVTHGDNGIYRCSLLNEGGVVVDEKNVTLTVLYPVEQVRLTLMDDSQTLADKTTVFHEGEQPISLTPGTYNVKCVASGSNPDPRMSLFYNEKRVDGRTEFVVDTSGDRVKYTGTISETVDIKAMSTPQTLTCNANIPGDHFPVKKAVVAMMVQVDKPDIVCSNLTTRIDSKYAKVHCNISAEGGVSAGLTCDKVSWVLGNENVRFGSEEKWKDPSYKLDIIESECMPMDHGLHVTLIIYDVKPSHFVEMYYLVYGVGESSHRIPVQLHEDTTAGVESVVATFSLIMCLIMATVVKQLEL